MEDSVERGRAKKGTRRKSSPRKKKYGDSFKENRQVQDLKANQMCEIGNERRRTGVDRPNHSRPANSRLVMGFRRFLIDMLDDWRRLEEPQLETVMIS